MKAFLVAWLLAVLITFLTGSIASSQFVLAELEQLGSHISLYSRLSATIDDLIVLLPRYGALIGIAFAMAFAMADWCKKQFHTGSWIFSLAGFTAILSIFFLMELITGINPIAGTESMSGLSSQCLAGALGGMLFAAMTHSKEDIEELE